MIPALNAGKFDAMAGMSKTAERLGVIAMSNQVRLNKPVRTTF